MSEETKQEPNAVIYKVSHINPEIKDFFIGATTVKRFPRIKSEFSKHYRAETPSTDKQNNNLVDFMKKNGGINDFKYEEIERLYCPNIVSRKTRVDKLVKELNARINNIHLEPKCEDCETSVLQNEGSSSSHSGEFLNSVVYMIKPNDPMNEHFYIGATKNLEDRKKKHYNSYYSNIYKNHNDLIYHIMRKNGGYDNFHFEIFEKFPCNYESELRDREDYWIRELKPTMNTINAVRHKEDDLCEHKNYKTRCVICKENGTGGNHLCKHSRRNGECPMCRDEGINQVLFCSHGISRKSRCLECFELPAGKCEHHEIYSRKENCVLCYDLGIKTATNICHHRTQKQNCKSCWEEGHPWATNLCRPHGERKDRCVDCGTSSKNCQAHNRNKDKCKLCWDTGLKPSGLCVEHGEHRGRCWGCEENGIPQSGICRAHGKSKLKQNCSTCKAERTKK